MKNALVSIIIPLYNSEPYISECVESCLKQTYKEIEILVIDDGSTDDGLKVVKEIAKNNNNITVIHTKNNGVSSARNLGINRSRGEYICFVDADDSIEDIFIETMVRYLENNGADFCFSKNVYNVSKRMVGGEVISSSEAEALLLSTEVKVGCWNKMYRKNILNDIRFRNDLFYGEGLFFINQVAHNSDKTIVCEDALYHYRKVNPNSATAKFRIEKMINGEKSLFGIRNIIKNDGRKVNRMWAQHYCLFCINAMMGLIGISGKSKEYRIWRRKMLKHTPSALVNNGKIKTKIRILLAVISPRLLYRIKH